MTSTGSDGHNIDGGEGHAPPTDIGAIQADIAQTRADLAETVEQVADHLNPKVQASRQAESAKNVVAETAAQAEAAAPEPIRHAIDSIAATAGPPAQRANAAVAPHRGKIAAGAAGVLVAVLVIRRRRSRS